MSVSQSCRSIYFTSTGPGFGAIDFGATGLIGFVALGNGLAGSGIGFTADGSPHLPLAQAELTDRARLNIPKIPASADDAQNTLTISTTTPNTDRS